MKTEKIDVILGRVISGIRKNPCQRKSERREGDPVAGSGNNARNDDIESVWFRIIDDRFKAHSYVKDLSKDRLLVKIDSSCYLAAFNMQKKELLDKLHEAGFVHIRKLEFKI